MPVRPSFSLKEDITLNESDNLIRVPAILLFHKKVNSYSRKEHRNRGHAWFFHEKSKDCTFLLLSWLSSECEKKNLFFFFEVGGYFSLW